MRLVAIGDLHAHYWKAFSAGHNEKGTRFLRTLQVLRESLEASRAMECPWLFAGDWIHTIGWSHNGIMTHLIRLLREYPSVEKVTVWGNHDARSHGDEIKRAETVVEVFAQSVPNLTLLNQTFFEAENGLRIWGEGYQPDRKFLKIPRLGVESIHVGLFHQTVSGSKLATGLEIRNSIAGLSKEELFKNFRLSIVGDIHHPQAFIENDRVILVPGSPEHHNFGDVSDHGWWICEVADDGTRCLLQPSKSPQFLTVQTIDQAQEDGNFYRVLTPCDPKLYRDRAVQVVAPPPTTISERSFIKEGADVRDILSAWLSLSPEIKDTDEYLKVGIELLDDEGLVTMKAVKLKKVTLRGFMCFAEEEFEIESGVVLVTGEARDYESNGAGKTTLFESIFWTLFGRTTKGMGADEVIQYGVPEAEVTLTIEDVDTEQIIEVCRTRRRGEGGKFHVSTDGQVWGGGAADLTKDLAKYLGVTPDLFQALTYFSQSKLVLFSQATDAERKTMLSDLCGLSTFTNASQTAREYSQDRQRQFVLLEQSAQNILAHSKHSEELIADSVQRQAEWKAGRAIQVESLKSELGRLERAFSEFDSQLTIDLTQIDLKYKTHFQTVEGVRDQRRQVIEADIKNRILSEKDLYNEMFNNTPEEARTGSAPWKEEHERATAAVNETKTKYEVLRSQLTAADKAYTKALELKGECPTCGQSITEEFHQAHLDRLGVVVGDLKADQGELEYELAQRVGWASTALRMRLAADQLHMATVHRDSQLDRLTRDFERASQQVEHEIAEEMGNLHQKKALEEQAARSKISAHKAQSTARQHEIAARVQEIAMEVDPFTEIIQKARDHMASLEKQALETSAEIGISRRRVEILDYWAKGLSRSGVQSILLEGIAANFNQIRSRIFPLLTRGIYDVQFSTTSQTAEGEAREKTEFVIRDRDALVSYESLSGGQRRRIDLGVMLSLALAVSSTRQVPGVLGLMILDEVFGFLDSDGVEALYETLGEVEKVIPSIYAITHDPSLQSLFSHTVLVRQDEHGVSRLVNQPSVGE